MSATRAVYCIRRARQNFAYPNHQNLVTRGYFTAENTWKTRLSKTKRAHTSETHHTREACGLQHAPRYSTFRNVCEPQASPTPRLNRLSGRWAHLLKLVPLHARAGRLRAAGPDKQLREAVVVEHVV